MFHKNVYIFYKFLVFLLNAFKKMYFFSVGLIVYIDGKYYLIISPCYNVLWIKLFRKANKKRDVYSSVSLKIPNKVFFFLITLKPYLVLNKRRKDLRTVGKDLHRNTLEFIFYVLIYYWYIYSNNKFVILLMYIMRIYKLADISRIVSIIYILEYKSKSLKIKNSLNHCFRLA